MPHESDELEGSEANSADEGSAIDWSSEEAELDRLYRQALDVVDEIEREMQLPWDESPAADDAAAAEDANSSPSPASRSAATEESALTGSSHDAVAEPSAPRVTPSQVLEAALFVGGKPLTTKTLVHLLRDEFDAATIDDLLDRLNARYLQEDRPYEIRLVEGGWQLQLRSEYEPVRHRVYGLGPREVKLSQEAIEVLSLVAYHQPISAEGLIDLGKASPGAVVRQLLRRELIAIERGAGGRNDVKYRTTARFLQLFDLASLDDLPQAEELQFK